jgi:hypothetical protein
MLVLRNKGPQLCSAFIVHLSECVLISHQGKQPSCLFPTLSELIEACGRNFGLVRLSNGTWNAATPVIDTGMSYGNPSTEV